MCYTEGILQAYIDGELDGEQVQEIDVHLNKCSDCRKKAEELRLINDFVGAKMQTLLNTPLEIGSVKIKGDGKMSERKSFFYKYKKMAATAAAVLAIVTTFSFPGVRGLAGEFLTVFRAEKMQTITIDPSEMNKLELALREGASKVDVENFGKVEVTGNNETVPVTLAEAQKAVDFDLKLPEINNFNSPELLRTNATTTSLTLDVNNINQLLQALNSSKLLPESLDGKTFSLHMPVAVVATYKAGNEKILVAQSKSPELKAPQDVDVLSLRDALLSIPALPSSIKNQLEAVNDWQHTVLIPNINGTSREVTVNGMQGVFIDPTKENPDAMKSLVWQKNGVICSITAKDLDYNSFMIIADQMK